MLGTFKTILVISLLFITTFFNSSFVYSFEADLPSAQNAVGKRFASKFCEAKRGGLSGDNASEFALNNTYLKFVAFPDESNYVSDLWAFTLENIKKECEGEITNQEVKTLHDFFEEEAEIAVNREFYLPTFQQENN